MKVDLKPKGYKFSSLRVRYAPSHTTSYTDIGGRA